MNIIENKQDKRCLKTRKAIKNAFVTLLSEKDIQQITIKEIAELADINRKTFYAHYTDTQEVMDEIEKGIIDAMLAMLDQTSVIQDRYDPRYLFENLSKVLTEDPKYYQYLLRSSSHGQVLMKIKTAMKPKIIGMLMENFTLDSFKMEYGAEFVLSGVIAIYQHWMDGNQEDTIEDVSKFASELAYHGINMMLP